MNHDEFAARTESLKSRLYRTALLYVGNETVAIDAVGESIYLALRSLRQLRQPEYFDTWITRILINQCKKALRHKQREQLWQTIPETACDQYDALPLKEAIHSLPRELKEVVILRYFTGFTLAQTAQSLEIPQGTVVTRQRRALRLLKLELSEEE